MSIEATETESAAVAVSPATRVSLADIEANIAYEFSFRAGDAASELDFAAARGEVVVPYSALNLLTVHIIMLRNGFIVVGKSAPADAANFNEELGRKFAREDAIRQIWPLMGYAMSCGQHSNFNTASTLTWQSINTRALHPPSPAG